MVLTLKHPDRESIKREIRIQVNAYLHAITVLGSLKEHLELFGIPCHIEKKIEKNVNGFKTPDLLVCSKNYIFVDHKYTESMSEKTLSSKINEMREYDTTYIYKSKKFKPEIVMLIPEKATKYFKKILQCPITWGYVLDGELIITQSVGSVKDSKILSFFTPKFFCPKAKENYKYRFIISHSPLPYTACNVYALLWTLQPPSNYFASEFDVDYNKILDQFNTLFSPWVSNEVKQLNDRRLKHALSFLQSIGWIKYLENEKKIIFFRNKGKLAGDTLEHFIDKCTEVEYLKQVEKYENEIKQTKKSIKDEKQTSLDNLIFKT